jgi:hypothetical protein
MTDATTVKRGDALSLPLNLGQDLSGYSSAKVILRQYGLNAIEITGTIAPGTGGIVTVALTPTHTAVVGDYNVEVEMSPGPNTFPSSGYVVLRVTSDLNPT